MARFIELNKIPMSPVLGYWDSTEALLKELPETLQYSKVILKCCHLTAGSAASTRMITRDKLKDPEYMKVLHADALPNMICMMYFWCHIFVLVSVLAHHDMLPRFAIPCRNEIGFT